MCVVCTLPQGRHAADMRTATMRTAIALCFGVAQIPHVLPMMGRIESKSLATVMIKGSTLTAVSALEIGACLLCHVVYRWRRYVDKRLCSTSFYWTMYVTDDPSLLQPFATLIDPGVTYTLAISMDNSGLSTYILMNESGQQLETQTVQHANACVDNYYEGVVQGLYFGGNCRAPEEVGVQYTS
jgi:hypothetical protein